MLEFNNICKSFHNKSHHEVNILNHVSFKLESGEICSITGKSGAGKSTLARIACGTIRPSDGEIFFQNKLLLNNKIPFPFSHRTDIQIIPQQPYLSFDPKQRIGDAIAEPMLSNKIVLSKAEANEKVKELLSKVWLNEEMIGRFPSQISGGQAQRAAIARCLGLQPKIIIADEATSMLDISAQAQVIQILKEQREQNKMTILFISHDISLIKAISDNIYHLTCGNINKIY